ncbi:hypothetical protein L9F63_007406, partial [Diploptera punctata]
MAFVLKRYNIHNISGLSTHFRSVLFNCPILCSSPECHTNVKRDYQDSRNREDYSDTCFAPRGSCRSLNVYSIIILISLLFLLQRCFEILEIPSNSDQEHVPDEEKFHLVFMDNLNLSESYVLGRLGMAEKKDDIKEFDIKHTAPQHRHYLSYGGFGIGTPQQREKQFQKHRAQKAVENIHSHRISKIAHEMEDGLVLRDKQEAQKIKLRSEMDRLVEDLIQESMQRGDFDNLAGKGKPLKHQANNPYVDFVTYKMNQ